MKRLIVCATLLAFMPTAQASEGKADFSHDAEYRMRYQYDQNFTGTEVGGSKDTFWGRFKLGTTFRSGEKFAAHMTLLHNHNFGSDFANGDGPAEPKGTGDGENMILVNEAYGTWMLGETSTLKFGRGGFTMGDGLVVSRNDWEATPYSFEGLMYTNEMEMMRTSLFYVKFGEDLTAAGDVDPNISLLGLFFDFKSLPEMIKMANIHVMQTATDTTTATGTGDNQMRYGLSVKGDVSGFDFHVSYNAHSGETKATPAGDISGSMMHANLGFSMPEMMNSRLYFTYHTDTGDDSSTASENEEYDPFFYEKHETAGLMDIVAWGNLTEMALGYSFSPMDQTSVDISYHMFSRTETTDGINLGNNGAFAANVGGANDDDAVGTELDVAATYKYDGGLMTTARLGMFTPGDYLKNQGSQEETINQIFLEAKMNF